MATENGLRLRQVVAGYGELTILRGLDLELAPGSVTSVIGANGAGKSTLLKTVAGVVHATSGSIILGGSDITGLSTRERVDRGVVLVPQGRCNFPLMTVHENLEMGAYLRADTQVADDIEAVYDRYPVLGEKRKMMAGNLSGGEQQLLEMSMALMLKPAVVLIDEPSLGLSRRMQRTVFEAVAELGRTGTTVLMVEQNAVQALEVSDMGVVVEMGRVAKVGSGVGMLEDPAVRRAYLGLPEHL